MHASGSGLEDPGGDLLRLDIMDVVKAEEGSHHAF